MRALIPLTLASAATLLTACTPTGPGPEGNFRTVVLTVAPSSATIGGGRTLSLTARALGEDGESITPSGVSWSSSDAAVAGVGSGGLVEGRKSGEARIVATWGSAWASAMVTVVDSRKQTPDDPTCPAVRHEAETHFVPTPSC